MADRLPADLARVDPSDAWKPWSPSTQEPWDRKHIAHLFRRAAFGATPAAVDAALAAGFRPTLDRLLRGDPDASELAETLAETGSHINDPNNLRNWWLYAMTEGGHPLREKLTLFWHNHFATSYAKVRSTSLMYDQNVALRKHALGRFRPFLLDMSRDTAMLIWLDSNRNEKGAANENFAREVMELFSLGVGNYTEADVKEAARAFTGWHHDLGQSTFEYHPEAHDDGAKTVLGQTGAWSGADVIRICCDQPSCARFLVGKLYAFLVSETPPPKGLLSPLEDRFRKTDYDIADLVGTILGSRLFFSSHAYRKRVKWPVEYVLGAIYAVGPGRVPLGDLIDPLARMGQVLFSPPNVKGWRTGTDWLNSATLLARNNYAETVALGTWSAPGTRRGRGPEGIVAFSTPATAPPAQLIPYSEQAAGAVTGGLGQVTVSEGFTLQSVQGGSTFIAIDPNAKPSAPPPAPGELVDPITTLYAVKPRDVPGLVRRMGELLFGEPAPSAASAKIESYLRDDGKAPDFQSSQFKARVREALHAMMCLPEYQLS